MSWKKKIDNKNYVFGTSINFAFALYAGLPQIKNAWWLCYLLISAVLNQFFTILSLSNMVERMTEGVASSKFRLMFYLIFKSVFLVSGFICLLIFIPDMVPQGLLIYIFQLIILGLSIKNIGNFFKKGSEP